MIEEIYEAEKGVEFMTSTRGDWGNTAFAGHLTWHLTLYYYGKPNNIVIRKPQGLSAPGSMILKAYNNYYHIGLIKAVVRNKLDTCRRMVFLSSLAI